MDGFGRKMINEAMRFVKRLFKIIA